MATFNLVRNSRVFFTTNVDPNTGKILLGGTITAANTKELQVLDGFSFSQATNADTVNISEAGSAPVRGQRSFNTSLGNVEFSFSTYIRPAKPSTTVLAEENVLWNALLSDAELVAGSQVTPVITTPVASYTPGTGRLLLTGTGAAATGLVVDQVYIMSGVTGLGANQYNTAVKFIGATSTVLTFDYLTAPTAAVVSGGFTGIKLNKTAWTDNVAIGADTAVPAAYGQISSAVSNKNQLQKFGMYFMVDNILYAIHNAAMDQAVIDFGLDGIATVAWTGKATEIAQLPSTAVVSAANPGVFSGAGNSTGTAAPRSLTAGYITNKLSTTTLISNIGGVGGTTYNLALTGGSITIANNITYVVPANLGVVNLPIGYFTGTRAVSGSLTAYLRTGTNGTAAILNSMLTNAATSVDPKFKLQVDIGGSTAATKVEVLVDAAMVQIPTIDAQAVMSTTINFTAQGSEAVQSATSNYDIENTNDLRVRYFSATTV